jgi:hypothetical protein
MSPRVVARRPPNFAAIERAFGPLPPNTVFAYGDTIYSPSSDELPPDLVEHEKVHLRQQAAVGGPDEWWRRYIEEPAFRLEQELEAYRAQVATFADRARRRECARRVARDLAGPIYGRLITKGEAFRLLTHA